MTGLLQPLNVVVNKIFQELDNETFQRRSEFFHAKTTSYQLVSDRISNWHKEINTNVIPKAFIVCGDSFFMVIFFF